MTASLREFLALGVLIGGGGLLMLPFQPTGTPQFVLSALSALIGLLLVLGVFFVQKRFNRDDHDH
jgi:hypothetical protein